MRFVLIVLVPDCQFSFASPWSFGVEFPAKCPFPDCTWLPLPFNKISTLEKHWSFVFIEKYPCSMAVVSVVVFDEHSLAVICPYLLVL